MSSHRLALVPLEAWAFSSVDVKAGGRDVDIGLLAEALIYYDSVMMSVSSQAQLATIIRCRPCSRTLRQRLRRRLVCRCPRPRQAVYCRCCALVLLDRALSSSSFWMACGAITSIGTPM